MKIPPVVWVLVFVVAGYFLYRRYRESQTAAAPPSSTQSAAEQPVMVVNTVPANGYLPGMPLWNVYTPSGGSSG